MERVDEKGKVFTQRVRKHCIEVDIETLQARVHGFLHVMPGSRVKDQLNNRDEQFLAITFATIMKNANPGAESPPEPQHVTFMAINKQHVVSVVPINDRQSTEDDEEGYHY